CRAAGVAIVVGAATRSGPPPSGHPPAASAVPVDGSGPGAGGQQDDGTQAAAWSSSDATTWTTATISPQPGVGALEEMDGCLALPAAAVSGASGAASGLSGGTGPGGGAAGAVVAWGQTTGRGGGHLPALWESTDRGGTWTRLSPAGVTGAGIAPWADVAASGERWLAAGGAEPAALAVPDDPRWAADDPVGPPPDPSYATGPDGEAGVWLSTDGGSGWVRLATAGGAWAGAQVATEAVAWSGRAPVVAGVVDGRLALWTGTPTTAAAG
ncbi:MAG: hypothetical protein ACYDEN_11210, partial [Acidimicrobiales bacterium]